MSFTFHKMEIPDVILIKPKIYADKRGSFVETYKHTEFITNGITDKFVQDNWSRSAKGTLRGLHFQHIPEAQAKLVMALRGEVFDVAVDIRRKSPTYGRWVGLTLSDSTMQMLYIPAGFAHGFCVLSDEADFIYKVSAEYSPALDSGIRWNDPDIAIEWPITNPLLSQKDSKLPLLKDTEFSFD